jgi:hypothetical protein
MSGNHTNDRDHINDTVWRKRTPLPCPMREQAATIHFALLVVT